MTFTSQKSLKILLCCSKNTAISSSLLRPSLPPVSQCFIHEVNPVIDALPWCLPTHTHTTMLHIERIRITKSKNYTTAYDFTGYEMITKLKWLPTITLSLYAARKQNSTLTELDTKTAEHTTNHEELENKLFRAVEIQDSI